MKIRICQFLGIILPSLLLSETIILLDQEVLTESEKIEEVSKSLKMILTSEFQEVVFEKVERESAVAYGGSIRNFIEVVYDPYRMTLIINGKTESSKAFERFFAEVFVNWRLNDTVAEAIQRSESIRNEIKELKNKKASNNIDTGSKNKLEEEIKARERKLKAILSNFDDQRSKWIVAQAPILITAPADVNREPNDADNPVNSPENPKNHPDD